MIWLINPVSNLGLKENSRKVQVCLKEYNEEVWAEGIEKPVAARYAWSDNPVCNLYRKDGSVTLPVTPFRTDDFPMITKGM